MSTLLAISDDACEHLTGGSDFGGTLGYGQRAIKDLTGAPIPIYLKDNGYEPSYFGRSVADLARL